MGVMLIGYIAAFLTCIGYLFQVYSQLKDGDFGQVNLPAKALILAASCFWVLYGLFAEQQAILVVGSLFTSISFPIVALKIQYDMKEQVRKKKFPPIQSRYESLRRERV